MPEKYRDAHTKGMNMQSIGICLIGKSNSFTQNQLNSLFSLLKDLKNQFGDIKISQHSDWEPKKPYCAGLDQSYITELNQNI